MSLLSEFTYTLLSKTSSIVCSFNRGVLRHTILQQDYNSKNYHIIYLFDNLNITTENSFKYKLAGAVKRVKADRARSEEALKQDRTHSSHCTSSRR